MLSDNPNRSTADVKSTVGKLNGKIAESGSVLFMYDRKGKIEVPVVLDEEKLLEAAIEAGCEDMELIEVRISSSCTHASRFSTHVDAIADASNRLVRMLSIRFQSM